MKHNYLVPIWIFFVSGALLTACAPSATSVNQAADTFTPQAGPALTAGPSATMRVLLTQPPSPAPMETSTLTPLPTLAPVVVEVAEGDGFTHQPVFTIHNSGRYSGEDGSPKWLGWGAGNFSLAPDGSFWIADTPADPDRLLHYSPQGELLGIIPMSSGNRQFWANDIAVNSSGIWLLDTTSQPRLVLHFGFDGSLLAGHDIPEYFSVYTQESTQMAGLVQIQVGKAGDLILEGLVGIVEMTVSGESAHFKETSGYSLGGRFYTDVENGVKVDDIRLEMEDLQPDHFLNDAWLLGVAPDGSFYVRLDEGNNDQGKAEPPDRFVRRYSASGDLLGVALLPLPELHQAYDVALGPDGNVYAIYSQADHSVAIMRLGFSTGAPPLLSPVTVAPQPAFQPLLPSGKKPITDEEAAREAMLSFFHALVEWRFEDAAAQYGGSYDQYQELDEAISADQPGIAWQDICQMEVCLEVSDILDTRMDGPDRYNFLVGFVTGNGIRFDYSICCGFFTPVPAQTWFVYSVSVERVNGQWKVMGGPRPLP